MRRLKDFGVGLPLYGVLLVLPAVFLMVLHGYGLFQAYKVEEEALPLLLENNRFRLAEALHERFTTFVDHEEARPYFEYAQVYAPDDITTPDLVLLTSPLVNEAAEGQLEAWFQADLSPAAPDYDLKLILNGARGTAEGSSTQELFGALDDVLAIERERRGFVRPSPGNKVDTFEIPLITAAAHADRGEHPECLRACRHILQGRSLEVALTRFQLLLFRDSTGLLRLAALRHVTPADTYSGLIPELPKAGRCMDALSEGFDYVQGFFIDPGWVLEELPSELGALVLDPETRLAVGPAARQPAAAGELKKPLSVESLLTIERAGDLVEPHGGLAVYVDATTPRSRFQGAILRFGAVAVMLILSLGTGLYFMSTNVRQKLAQARRTQNFVAAVTHELRTPLASIRLHGEMLQDGIPQTPEARNEYYERILGETERLSVLVENILLKSRLDAGGTKLQPADLSDVVRRLESQLCSHGRVDLDAPLDLAFELEAGLPPVALNVDALNSILRNLVGNARKYAPPVSGGEPLLVRTRREGRAVLLEVLDRGPGVPEAEARQIFDAFYRVGDEATREKPGTGLGLHLVELQARAMDAEVSYRPRPGGGANFTVAFPPAGRGAARDSESDLQ